MQRTIVTSRAAACSSQLGSAARCPPGLRPQRRQWPTPARLACQASAHGPDDASTSAASQSSGSSSEYQFTYAGSDGRMKATFEQAFKRGGTGGAAGDLPAAPWGLGYQMAEKNLVWSDDLKARMLQRVAAQQLGLSDEELEARLARVATLLPSLRSKLPSMPASTLAALAAQVDELAGRLVRLKTIFPDADVGALVAREPALVLGLDLNRLAGIAAQLREMLPRLDVDRLVAENPAMLDIEGLKAAMAEAKRILPDLDIQQAMASDPQLVFSFQRGSQLIPYDPPDQPHHGEPGGAATQRRDDDEYSAYYR